MRQICLALCVVGLATFFEHDVRAEDDDGGFTIGRRPQPKNLDLATLRARVRGADLEQVVAAAEQLSQSREPRAIAILWSLYNEGDAQRRLVAVQSIATMAQPGQEESLVKVALGEAFQAIRQVAVRGLLKTDTQPKATARLAAAAADEKNVVPLFRFRALQALAMIGGKDAEDVLIKYLKSPLPDLALASAEGLGRSQSLAAIDALLSVLNTPDENLKQTVADSLGRISGERFRYDLVKWTQWRATRAAQPLASANLEAPYADPADIPADAPLDIVVVFDTTLSMLHVWPELNKALDGVLSEESRTIASMRVGTVKYRAPDVDRTLSYVVQSKPLTRRLDAVREELKDASFGGNSGALHLAVDHAIRSMNWRLDSRKLVILIGDTSPPDEFIQPCQRMIYDAWQLDRIQINTLYVKTSHGPEHAETYRRLAQAGVGWAYDYDKTTRKLTEINMENPALRTAELPTETAHRWLKPRKKK